MEEYSLGIYRQFGKFPKQLVLYVGELAMRMAPVLRSSDSNPDVLFRYSLFDFRDLDGAVLLDCAYVEDNLLSILARLQDPGSAVRQILSRIAGLEETQRRDLFENS